MSSSLPRSYSTTSPTFTTSFDKSSVTDNTIQWPHIATTALACAAAATAAAAVTAYYYTARTTKQPQPTTSTASTPLSITTATLPPYNLPTTTLATTPFGTPARTSLFTLNPHTTFLNHGSYGAVPLIVQRYHTALIQRVEQHPDVWFRFHSYQLVRQAASQYAEFIGAQSEDVVFVTNATSAVNAVLASLQLTPEDVIITPDLTYQACKLAMQSVAQRTRATYMEVKVPLPATADSMVAALREFLDSHTTTKRIKFALFDIITSPTAVVFPYAAVCALCRERGIVTMLDAAHSLGQLPLRVTDTHCDYLTTNCHKWCYSPKGTALLWVSPAAPQHLPIHPSITSHAWRDQSLAARFWMQGTRDDTAFVAASAGLAFYRAIGLERVYHYCTALADWAVGYLSEQWSVQPYPLYARDMSAPFMRVLELPVDVPSEVKAAGGEVLRRFGDRTLERLMKEYDLVVACFVYAEKLYVRFSVQIYNCKEDYIRLGELVTSLRTQ